MYLIEYHSYGGHHGDHESGVMSIHKTLDNARNHLKMYLKKQFEKENLHPHNSFEFEFESMLFEKPDGIASNKLSPLESYALYRNEEDDAYYHYCLEYDEQEDPLYTIWKCEFEE